MAEPLPEANESPPLELDGAPPMPGRVVGYYAHPLRHYLAVYGYSAEGDGKTIKRFVAKGKASGVLPPLDSPAEMPAWWRRHFPNSPVPDGMRRAASVARENGADATNRTDDAAPPVAADPIAGSGDARSGNAVRDDRGPQAMDFPAHVAALSAIAEDHLRELRRVTGETMPSRLVDVTDQADWTRAKADRIEAAQKVYRDSLEILRKAENNLVEWRKAHGELVDKPALGAEIARIFSAVDSAVKRLLVKTRPRLVGKTDAEQDAIWNEERREIFRVLTTSGFDASAVLAA